MDLEPVGQPPMDKHVNEPEITLLNSFQKLQKDEQVGKDVIPEVVKNEAELEVEWIEKPQKISEKFENDSNNLMGEW